MYHYVSLDDDDKFLSQIRQWKEEGVTSVAMDFEGEFNLHIYGEHLCLIQLYDGRNFFLADPFRLSRDALETFLADASIEKVMFSCDSDASLVRKEYRIQMENVYDVRIPAMALGYMGNLCGLMDLYSLPHEKENKKKNQTDNWLVRPLPERQKQYALGDVAQLLALKPMLERDVKARHLEKLVKGKMKRCARAKNSEKPGWEKLPSYRFLSPREQMYAKHFFLARDGIARRRNVPAVRVMDKRLIVSLARNVPTSEEALEKRVPSSPVLLDALWKAKAGAEEEIARRERGKER